MRSFVKIHLIAAAALLLVAGTANAWTFSWTPSSTTVGAGQSVTIDIRLDSDTPAEIGLQLMGFVVVSPGENNMGPLQWQQGATTSPTYLLYAPATGTTPVTYLIPDPPIQIPPGATPNQTNVLVSYREVASNVTSVAASNTLIANLVYQAAVGASGPTILSFSDSENGAIFRVCDLSGSPCSNLISTAAGGLNLPADITITVPEPAMASLSLAAVATVYGIRRRRRSA